MRKDEVVLKKIIDGNTIEVVDNKDNIHRIRLYGIDTPEKHISKKLDKDIKNGDTILKNILNKNITKEEILEAGNTASQFLNNNLKNGQKLQVKILGNDKYNRLVAIVYNAQININDMLIKEGYAVVNNKFIKSPTDLIKMNSFQQNAKIQNKGLWESHYDVMSSLN